MRGIISSRTLRLAQHLRSEGCVRLILVSGMRGTTLLKRLPFLPRADAYACDSGGRIFYPVDCSDCGDYDGPIIQPVEYQGASSKDLEPFGIVEDEEWIYSLSHSIATDNISGSNNYLFKGRRRHKHNK